MTIADLLEVVSPTEHQLIIIEQYVELTRARIGEMGFFERIGFYFSNEWYNYNRAGIYVDRWRLLETATF